MPAPINSAIPPYYSHTRQNGATPEHAGALAVSGDGRTAVSGGDDGTVRVWDLDSALEQARWIADADVLAVAVSTAVAIAGDAAGRVHALRLDVPAQASA